MLSLPLYVLSNPNAVGQLPVMGWSGYNALMQDSGHCDKAGAAGYNETTFMQTAAVLEKSGLRALGYVYMNLVSKCTRPEQRPSMPRRVCSGLTRAATPNAGRLLDRRRPERRWQAAGRQVASCKLQLTKWQSTRQQFHVTRDKLQADPTRFPHGMAWLAERAHERQLKLGVCAVVSAIHPPLIGDSSAANRR